MMQKLFSSFEYKTLSIAFLFLLPAVVAVTYFLHDGMVYFLPILAFFIVLSLLSLLFLYLEQNVWKPFGFFSIIPLAVTLLLIWNLTTQASRGLLFSGLDPELLFFVYPVLFASFVYLSPSLYVFLRTVTVPPATSKVGVVLSIVILLAGHAAYVLTQKDTLSEKENWPVEEFCDFVLKVPPQVSAPLGQPDGNCADTYMWSNSGGISVDEYEAREARTLSEWINSEWIHEGINSWTPYDFLFEDGWRQLYFSDDKAKWQEFFDAHVTSLLSDKKERIVDGEIAYQFRDIVYNNTRTYSVFIYHKEKIVKIKCRYDNQDFSNTCDEIIDNLEWNK